MDMIVCIKTSFVFGTLRNGCLIKCLLINCVRNYDENELSCEREDSNPRPTSSCCLILSQIVFFCSGFVSLIEVLIVTGIGIKVGTSFFVVGIPDDMRSLF